MKKMAYQIKILMLAFAIAFVIALIVIPILKRKKIGQNEREDGPQSHLKKQGTPTMGGIIMILSLLIMGGILFFDYSKSSAETERNVAYNLIPLILGAVGFGIIGFIDDFIKKVLNNTKGLKPLYKMIGLLVISVALMIYFVAFEHIGTDIVIPFAKIYVTLPVWIYIPFMIIVMLATTNAINLTDGIDGLSTSVTTIILTCLTVIGIISGVKEIVLFGASLIGICLAFLLFNLYPAKVIMGDTGSLFLGGAVSIMAIYLKMPLLLIIIAIIPVLETLSDIIQVAHYKRTGKRVFKMAPIHHHFELCGWNENTIVSVFSIITLIACLIGLVAI
jgi:phospho-N-acetylmuramoyl-pentapeptide-transferase